MGSDIHLQTHVSSILTSAEIVFAMTQSRKVDCYQGATTSTEIKFQTGQTGERTILVISVSIFCQYFYFLALKIPREEKISLHVTSFC